ncbi:4a-hydroxytetrahydrobiopterin dehydratase [Motiliproteus sp. SC1-56]|uniref:4a-hydroxytetrahydrobiopterin dehydratase n=1 Tax=Motiliproteus sp. SC1-56 TaxID=2799565 RepID=UPI001A8F672E|nr:4a-hydroxytetrahydrobiopterin dehydratase [Motiliproteus sp. SC1-56]
MSNLDQQQCEACRADAPRVEEDEARELIKAIPQWQIVEMQGVPRLVRRFSFKNFAQALGFTNRVGEMAESQQHHPDLITRWGEVEVHWWTHKIKGLHRNDFICAARCERLYEGD